MRTIRDKLRGARHLTLRSMPEALLALFAISLLPLLYYMGAAAVRTVMRFASDSQSFYASVKADPWPLVTWLACAGGGIAATLLLWRSRTLVWAVARKLIFEALHRKVVVVLLVFFVVLMPSLPFILKTEGNPKSQVQIVLTYALGLAEVLLCLVAVFLCTASICTEIERKHVQVTDTKPLHRWQFLAGKLFGVVVLCAAVLFLMAGSIYLLVRYVARDRDLSRLPPAEAQKQDMRLKRVQDQVLVTRRSIRPPVPDVSNQVEAEIKKLEAQGQLKVRGLKWQKRKDLTRDFQKWAMTIKPGNYIVWHIGGFASNKEQPIFLRFTLSRVSPEADELVLGEWQCFWYAKRAGAEGEDEQQPVLVWRDRQRWTCGPFLEIRLPGEVVDRNGFLHMVYLNLQPDTSVSFEPEGGIELLRRAEGFFPNYYRSLLVILCHVVLLASLALMAGSALSFPVASLTVAGMFVAGLIAPWVSSTYTNLTIDQSATGAQFVFERVYWFVKISMKGISAVIPNLTRYSPIGDLVSGRMVSWTFVGEAATMLCLVQGLAVMLLAVYLYNRRELARVIV